MDHLHVAPTSMPSPLQWHLRGQYAPGFRFRFTGQAVPLMDWQAGRAFAGVPENSLKQLAEKLHIDMTGVIGNPDMTYADKLAMVLLVIPKNRPV